MNMLVMNCLERRLTEGDEYKSLAKIKCIYYIFN